MDKIHTTYFQKIIQTSNYTGFVLKANNKPFIIYADPHVGQEIQNIFSQSPSSRPKTHELIHSLFKGLDVSIKHLLLTESDKGIFFSSLFLEKQNKETVSEVIELDVRPSDGLILALQNDAPIFCLDTVISKVKPFIDMENE